MKIKCVLNNNTAIWKPVAKSYGDLLEEYLEGLEKYVTKDEVEIHYVPEINKEHVETLRERGYTVIEHEKHPLSHITKYCFKFYLFDTIEPDMIITDVDTLVKNDPHILLEKVKTFGARADPCSYRNPEKTQVINWGLYREALDMIDVHWQPPVICNGHMVFRDASKTVKYREYLLRYLHMLYEGALPRFMPDRYILFMASMLAVVKTYKRGEITYLSPEEVAIERYEHMGDRYIMMDRQRLGK